MGVGISFQSYLSLKEEDQKDLKNSLYALSLSLAVYAFLQRWLIYPTLPDNPDRVLGPFFHPNILAVFLLSFFLWGQQERKPVWSQLQLFAAALLTFSYSVLLVFGLIWLFFFGQTRIFRKTTQVLALVALAVGLLFALTEKEILKGNFSLEAKAQSFAGRIAIWKGSFIMFLHRPLTGFGLGHFPDYFPAFQQSVVYTRLPHSFLLALLTQLGLAGLLLFALFVIFVFKNWERSSANLALPLFMGLHGAIDLTLDAPGMALLFLFLPKTKALKWTPSSLLSRAFLGFYLLFVPVALSMFYWQAGNPWKASRFFSSSRLDFALYQECLKKEQFSCARSFLNRAFAQEPENWLYLYHRILMDWVVDKKPELAWERARKLLKLTPYNPASFALALKISQSLGKKESLELEKKKAWLDEQYRKRHLPPPKQKSPSLVF